jgi:hypothetical protein
MLLGAKVPRKTAQKIQQLLREGRFRYSVHCDQTRMDRVVTDEDIRNTGRTAHTTKLQANGTYKVIGHDETDLELTVVCRLMESQDLLLITVF